MVTWNKKDDDTKKDDDKPDAKWTTKQDKDVSTKVDPKLDTNPVATKVDDGTHANDTENDLAASKTSFERDSQSPPEATDTLPPVLQGRSAAALGQNIPVEHYEGDNHGDTWTCASCGRRVNGLHCPVDGDTQHGNGNGRAPGPSRGPTLPALPSTPATPNAVVAGAGSLDDALAANPPGPIKSSASGVTPPVNEAQSDKMKAGKGA